MKVSFNKHFKDLLGLLSVFDPGQETNKTVLLRNLAKLSLPKGKQLIAYCDALLFICSHPQNARQLKIAEQELRRVTLFLKRDQEGQKGIYQNSGLPHSFIFTRFSHDCLSWLYSQDGIHIELDSLADDAPLGEILKLTLPVLEKERTASGYEGDDLFEALQVKPKEQLPFLISQFNQFNHEPFLKDQLFERLDCYVSVTVEAKKNSKFYNKLQPPSIFFHQELLKKFDSRELLDRSLPPARKLEGSELEELVRCIKFSLFLKYRETDPVSYMEKSSLRHFELERGISVAIYGMTADRQLPLESYVGYTLFKNGFPAAYGGAWVFGQQALFGMNVFEAYRGGESAFMMCQLLRVYRQVFGVNYFEIEPYQFGKDNPEGIESGAYWFYYRLGFRSIDEEQIKLAERENQKIKTKKGYRSSPTVLRKLADSYLALTLGAYSTLTVGEISLKLTSLIRKKFAGDRVLAELEMTKTFRQQSGLETPPNAEEMVALKEMASLAAALNVREQQHLALLREMVSQKTKDVYAYQALLSQFLLAFQSN